MNNEAPLWAVHIQGPDDLVPVASYLDALRISNAFNAWWQALKTQAPLSENDPRVWASPVEWTGDSSRHADWVEAPSPDYLPFFSERPPQEDETFFFEILWSEEKQKYHPDVLAVHAEFGGDLEDMQRRYDAPKGAHVMTKPIPDGLVERLRARSAGPYWTNEIVSVRTCRLADEVADEIERLTAALASARAQGEAEGLLKAAEVNRAAAVESFRAWYFQHVGKRIYHANARVAVEVVLDALAPEAGEEGR